MQERLESKGQPAGAIEQALLRILLWREKKELTITLPGNRGRQPKDFILPATAASVAVSLILFLARDEKETTMPQSALIEPPVAAASGNPPDILTSSSGSDEKPKHQIIDWRRDQNVGKKIQEFRENNPGYLIGTQRSFQFLGENLRLVHESPEIILGVNQKGIRDWLVEIGNETKLEFVFEDIKNKYGKSSWNVMRVNVNKEWQRINGRTEVELYQNLSIYLSASLAITIEYMNEYGPQKAAVILSDVNAPENQELIKRFNLWQEEFKNQDHRLFVAVVTVNPEWIKKKLNQK